VKSRSGPYPRVRVSGDSSGVVPQAGRAAGRDSPQKRAGRGTGHSFTVFATNTSGGQLVDLELRHRRRARAEDRIRAARTTGLRNLPLHGTSQNQVWLEIVSPPWTCSHGRRCSPSTAKSAAGSPRRCACDCSPPQPDLRPPPAPAMPGVASHAGLSRSAWPVRRR